MVLRTYGNKKPSILDRSFTQAKEMFAKIKTKLDTRNDDLSCNYRIELSVTNDFVQEYKGIRRRSIRERLTMDAGIFNESIVDISDDMSNIEIKAIDEEEKVGVYCNSIEDVFYYDYESEIDDLYDFKISSNASEIEEGNVKLLQEENEKSLILHTSTIEDVGDTQKFNTNIGQCKSQSIDTYIKKISLGNYRDSVISHRTSLRTFRKPSLEKQVKLHGKGRKLSMRKPKDEEITNCPAESNFVPRKSSLCLINNKKLQSSDSSEEEEILVKNPINIRAKEIKKNSFKLSNKSIESTTVTSKFLKKYLNLQKIKFRTLPKEHVVKINEATFSDVYSVGNKVIKIVPLHGNNNEADFLKESYIAKVLNNEDGIIPLHDVFIANGCYPTAYLTAWYNFSKKVNKRPSRGKIDWGIIIMNHGGVDLEVFYFENLNELFYFLKRLLIILFTLEEKYEFEHRDLHWGNIMLKRTLKTEVPGCDIYDYPPTYHPFSINIIDFTLSRIVQNGRTIFTDLSHKDWLFDGDEKFDIQFRVYKKMKREDYSTFDPKSNFYWYEYLIDKIEERSGTNEVIQFFKNHIIGIDTIKDLYKKICE